MSTKAAIANLLRVTFLILLESVLSTSMNLWDALASGMGVGLNGPTLAPPVYESKLCSQPNIVCYSCDSYDDDLEGCKRRPDCVFYCLKNTCRDISDFSLSEINCISQCNPCDCQTQPTCLYSNIVDRHGHEKCSQVNSRSGYFWEEFTQYDCCRGSAEPYELYFFQGTLFPSPYRNDRGDCRVEKIAAEYNRESQSVFDDENSDRCNVVKPEIGDDWASFELVVVFDKLDDWLPVGKHRVFSMSIFNTFQMSLTLRREDFPGADKIKIYWLLDLSSRNPNSPSRDLRIQGQTKRGDYKQSGPFDIAVCDNALDSCFSGNEVVRPASIAVNKFEPWRKICEETDKMCNCILHHSKMCYYDEKEERCYSYSDGSHWELNECGYIKDNRRFCARNEHTNDFTWTFGFVPEDKSKLCWVENLAGPDVQKCSVAEVLIAINFNGKKYKDEFGIEYLPDKISDNEAERLNLKRTELTKEMCFNVEKPNTYYDPLFGTLIESDLADTSTKQCLTYSMPIKDGFYILLIKMVDPFLDNIGERLFDIKLNGKTLKSNVDIFNLSGRKFTTEYYNQACAKIQFLLPFEVYGNGKILSLEGHTISWIENKEITLSFCTGSCSKAKNSNFIVSAFTIFSYKTGK